MTNVYLTSSIFAEKQKDQGRIILVIILPKNHSANLVLGLYPKTRLK